MGRVAGLILGMILLVLGAQGGLRLLAEHDDAGILGWVPGGFAVRLGCYAAIVIAGVLLAGRSGTALRRPGSGH